MSGATPDPKTRPASGARSFSPSRYWLAPYLREEVVSYRIETPRLTEPLRIIVLSDFHAGAPFMPLSRVRRIVARAQSLHPDLILLPGDFLAERNGFQRPVPMQELARELAALHAPLGRFAVLGNHDWWDHPETQERRAGPVPYAAVLEDSGIPVLSNRHVTLSAPGGKVTLAGLESQAALRGSRTRKIKGLDDLDAALDGADPDRLTLLVAHEPGIFVRVPDHQRRIDLTISGHNHAGQVHVFGRPVILPAMPSGKFVHGHFTAGNCHLVVTAGLGCSRIPVRFGVVPEITRIDLVPA